MNRLAEETSPYLRQHVDNPVHWYPWGDEAFADARERDVPVLLSVGYSSCHWCHVMAHECFEDEEVAEAMNAAFVNVKVDREERPDVDALYMSAVQALTGRGGWPMTVLLDHDGRPFWGGTYLPKEKFLELISASSAAWRDRRDELDASAARITEAIAAVPSPQGDLPSLDVVNDVLKRLSASFDPEFGGFGTPPKFPSAHHLQLVLRAYMTSGSDDAKRVLETTLDAMAMGGMYDHIGGGFARYSTDREWLVPHFEKMLSDQALLVRTYREAFSVLGHARYRQVVTETIEYVLRDLRHEHGGFMAGEDADSPDEAGHGVEGLFHTWTPAEVRAALAGADPRAAQVAIDWWGITEAGNFEGRSIPNRRHGDGALGRPPELDAVRRRLLDVRSRRPRPMLADHVVTEWDAMFLASLADAAARFERDDWRTAAVANGEFLLAELRVDGRWHRTWHPDSGARHDALAGDHAALVDAFVELHMLTGQRRWVDAAVETADDLLDRFWDPVDGGVFTTPDEAADDLVARQKDLLDGAMPSANSATAHALLRIAALTGELRYRNQADRILQLLGPVIERSPGGVSNALLALILRRRGVQELVIPGDAPDLVRLAHVLWRPDVVVAWGERFDSSIWAERLDGHAYLCRDGVCDLPVTEPEALFERLTGRPAPEGLRLRRST